jgi:hypothetical protein
MADNRSKAIVDNGRQPSAIVSDWAFELSVEVGPEAIDELEHANT